MGYLFNFFYLLTLLFLSPWLVYKSITTGKYRRGMLSKFLGRVDHPLLDDLHQKKLPVVWFHGVSVGEIHLLAAGRGQVSSAAARLCVRDLYHDGHRLR